MTWEHYKVKFRLLSPLHIGYRKEGNLMRTRRYVPARTLWGALVANLAQACAQESPVDYGTWQGWIGENLRIGYFWPTVLKKSSPCAAHGLDHQAVLFPWEDPELFDYCFLDSVAATALDPLSHSATEGSLHQVEFISPTTRLGDPVYLLGDLWIRKPISKPNACKALEKVSSASLPKDLSSPQNFFSLLSRLPLALGGERTYGWGRVALEEIPANDSPAINPHGGSTNKASPLAISPLWCWRVEEVQKEEDGQKKKDIEVVIFPRDQLGQASSAQGKPDGATECKASPSNVRGVPIPAHVKVQDLSQDLSYEIFYKIHGNVEPLTAYQYRGKEGFQLIKPPIAFEPGSRLSGALGFTINCNDGLWIPRKSS